MAPTPHPEKILSFEDARHLVERHGATIKPCSTELVSLLGSCGRVLAGAVTADRDFPPFPRAARDGYAVQAADLRQLPAVLKVVGEVKAGVDAAKIPSIRKGEAVLIMTGAPAPDSADAVAMVENTSRAGEQVEIKTGIEPRANIVAKGSEARAGDQLLQPGLRLDASAIAVAASVGKSRVQVYAKPKIAVLATGDEVVEIEAQPGPTQIRNSNSYSLAAQILAAGGEARRLPIAPDEPGRLKELIIEGLRDSDLLLLSGGVSMGKFDFVEQVLAELQAEFLFTGVQIQPGRPVVFGKVPCGANTPVHSKSETAKYFLGLPGNPVSTMVTFQLFALPMIEALAGQSPRPLQFLHARLKSEVTTKPGLKRFLPAVLSGEFGTAEVNLARWGGSGDVAATAKSNCYLVIQPDQPKIAAGEWVPVLLK